MRKTEFSTIMTIIASLQIYCSYSGADNSKESSPSAPQVSDSDLANPALSCAHPVFMTQVVIPPNTPLKSAILRDVDYGSPSR